jgi:protein YIPF5/7
MDWYGNDTTTTTTTTVPVAASSTGAGFYGSSIPSQQQVQVQAQAQFQPTQFQPQLHHPAPQQPQLQQQQQPQQPFHIMNPYDTSLQGTMDQQPAQHHPYGMMGATTGSGITPTIMNPVNFLASSSSTSMNSIDSYGSSGSGGGGMEEDYANEPPLLEELGVHFDHIAVKTKAVILPFSRFQSNNNHHHHHNNNNNNAMLDPVEICKEADLAGPLAFCLLLGAEMVLMGKLQFGVIYGFGMFGCVSMTLIVNLMSPTEPISIWTVTSVLGYALLPVNGLALVKVFFMNQYTGINFVMLGRILALVTVAWSTTASTRLLEVGCGLRDQRYLIAYPVALLYCAFVLITIF